jgi:hypothetical protein
MEYFDNSFRFVRMQGIENKDSSESVVTTESVLSDAEIIRNPDRNKLEQLPSPKLEAISNRFAVDVDKKTAIKVNLKDDFRVKEQYFKSLKSENIA